MDQALINQLATSIVAALAPYLASAGKELVTDAAKAAGNKIGMLFEVLKKRLQSNPSAKETLDDLVDNPNDPDTQGAVRVKLKKQMEADPSFAAELQQYMRELSQDKQVTTFLTQIYGGDVGKIVNIGQADNVDIH